MIINTQEEEAIAASISTQLGFSRSSSYFYQQNISSRFNMKNPTARHIADEIISAILILRGC